MIVVLALIGILAGIAVPAFDSIIARTRLSTAANDVLLGLNVARSEAVRRNATVYFCLADAGGRWSVHQVAGDEIREGALPPSITADTNNLDTGLLADFACVRYRPDGLAYGAGSVLMTNGEITLTLGTSSRVVNVRTGGTYVG
ncbi:GspH/FimT family pseudopilin [Azoarcus olearius]|uniref:Type II secretion system protein H n=2 Tax=Azoarcus sp. (strain BH72) TaxID=418699 RepID=A1K9M4_AZOSB|nr:GspH/FimT family pseudopilin [Azoarcus olearius]ANQ86081.1 putative pre-pilin like protein [Azoarcus olearius]CAL95529.1 putative pre-pilin like protein [Azoarcus olearius]